MAISTDPRAPEPSDGAAAATRARGMTFGHEVLLALIMAVAMGATVFLYR